MGVINQYDTALNAETEEERRVERRVLMIMHFAYNFCRVMGFNDIIDLSPLHVPTLLA